MANFYTKTLQQVLETMYSKSVHDYEKDCWLWAGAIANGYGVISFKGRLKGVHQISYEYFIGEIKEGVYHTCDVPNCWNPDHLFTGTQQDNVNDRQGKWRHAFGERHGRVKLTAVEVLAIRASNESGVKLAKVYGVTPMTISLIKNNKIWSHI